MKTGKLKEEDSKQLTGGKLAKSTLIEMSDLLSVVKSLKSDDKKVIYRIMKTEKEILNELDTLIMFSKEAKERSEDSSLIDSKITALQWVLGQTSDIFND